jgi:hypothetical protein
MGGEVRELEGGRADRESQSEKQKVETESEDHLKVCYTIIG